MKTSILEDIQKFCISRPCNICPFCVYPEHIIGKMCSLAVEPWQWDTKYIEEKINEHQGN